MAVGKCVLKSAMLQLRNDAKGPSNVPGGNGKALYVPPFARGFSMPEPGALVPDFVKRNKIVRDLHGLPAALARAGSLEVRLAVTKKDIRRAQKLRWRVFFEQGAATAGVMSQLRRRDVCPFDRYCDHMIVVDKAAVTRFGRNKPRVVGAYRLLRQDVAERHGGFYSAGEFDIAPLLQRHPDKSFLELGRSCVDPAYRSRKALELLWRGILIYMRHHEIDVLMGCASFEGPDPGVHREALALLSANHAARGDWRVEPQMHCAANVEMPGGYDSRRAMEALPPLIKGYLRLGAMFGNGVAIDPGFGTTDVFVVLPVERIGQRYFNYFTTSASN